MQVLSQKQYAETLQLSTVKFWRQVMLQKNIINNLSAGNIIFQRTVFVISCQYMKNKHIVLLALSKFFIVNNRGTGYSCNKVSVISASGTFVTGSDNIIGVTYSSSYNTRMLVDHFSPNYKLEFCFS